MSAEPALGHSHPAGHSDPAGLADPADLADLTRQILARHRPGTVPADGLWAALEAAGVLVASLPASAGGAGLGLSGHAAVLTELGRAVAVTPYRDAVAVAAQVVASQMVASQMVASQMVAGQMVAGPGPAGMLSSRLATAWREPDAADPADPSTTAAPDGDGWRLTGRKTLVTEGLAAEVLLVTATGPAGPLVLAVPADAAGLDRQLQRPTDTVLGAATAWVALDAVAAGPDQVIGGVAVLTELLTRHALATCAEQAGVLAGAVDLTAEHVRQRHQFGRALGSFQAVSQRLADALIDVRALELALRQALRTAEAAGSLTDPQVQDTVDTAVYWAAQAGHRVAHTCVHLHGGTGIDLDHPAHRHFAAAKRLEFELGGATAPLRSLGTRLLKFPS